MNDVGWILISAGLVFLMQPGFMCLESGLTRTKNSINVAVKNLADFGISVGLFWGFSFGLMFGASWWGWFGLDSFLLEVNQDTALAAFFLFQAMFCSTATTIVSGAVAERLHFAAYGVIAVLVSGIIYPVFGHWAWNGIAARAATGWLQQVGFVDFAGATVVHSVGAWVALAALVIIGPRLGRFTPAGRAQKIHGSNLPMSVLGAMLLWFGWLGFNGGSTLAFNEQIAGIMVNTVMAGVAGMIAMTSITWWRTGIAQPESLINGSVSGLVSITASCHAVSTPAAVVIGAIGGIVTYTTICILERHCVDDAVDAIAVHGASGIWGTLAVALFGQSDLLGTGLSPISQLLVQLLGIGVCFLWAFGVAYGLLRGINHWFPLRVSAEAEDIGLNYAEHKAKTDAYELLKIMDEHARTKDLSLRVPVDHFTEVGHIATRYNQVMDALEGYATQLETFNAQLEAKVQARTTELAQANAELQQLDRLKNEFLANTSHELRTPLNGIIGIAESLMDGVTEALSQATRENLSLIVASGRRLSNLINDILDFSTLRQRTLTLQLRSISLRSLVDEVLTLSAGLIRHQSLQLVNEIPADLPPVRADENRLQQILHNLIGNAIKFTESGTVAISAAPLADDPEKKMVITVADTGMGIPAAKLTRIFESFEQADGSVARQHGGTGLGLAITRQLVETHGGNIWVESTVDVGSQFHFTLPLATPADRAAAGDTLVTSPPLARPNLEQFVTDLSISEDVLNPAAAESEGSKQRVKILIVDDEPVNLRVLRNHLALENYAIKQATGGKDVFRMIAAGFRPDLILLDVMMPHMTGYEVTRKLRERFSANELPILMLTAKNQVTDLIEGLETGANDYLSKPVAKNELLARIKTHLQVSQLSLAYSRFVPHEFLQLLQKDSILDVHLGDQTQQEMSVLFADIRNFTALSEQMTPAENFQFINAYLSHMEPAIVDNGGFIDKYIGDAIMALFPGSADQAVRSAIAMLRSLNAYNCDRGAKGYAPVYNGIGINSGSMMLGTVGGPSHMDSTVISDTVNLAARIEELTKRYEVPLLISWDTLMRLQNPNDYAYRLIDRVQVRGRTEPVSIFEVFDADPIAIRDKKQQLKTVFETALTQLNMGKYAAALAGFETCIQAVPEDGVAIQHRDRCRQLLKALIRSGQWKEPQPPKSGS
ncbi:MAG: ammonium transporter [Leptolyngbya sp. SIO1E4]|nr:ammonium transporter [Leptolyngbya sp. SIO1E4]